MCNSTKKDKNRYVKITPSIAEAINNCDGVNNSSSIATLQTLLDFTYLFSSNDFYKEDRGSFICDKKTLLFFTALPVSKRTISNNLSMLSKNNLINLKTIKGFLSIKVNFFSIYKKTKKGVPINYDIHSIIENDYKFLFYPVDESFEDLKNQFPFKDNNIENIEYAHKNIKTKDNISLWRRENLGKEYKKIKKELLKDFPKCPKCKNNKSKEVHHIVPIRMNPDKAKDKENLIPLCESCHKEVTGNEMEHFKELDRLRNQN